MNQDIERQREEIRRKNAHADQIAMQKGEGRNVVSDAAIRAREEAAELATVPIDERSGTRLAARMAEARAEARAPRRLRLNVTGAAEVSPGYVRCSLYQSENGVNWACSGTDLVFGAGWFEDVFGAATYGRRIEFDLVNIHEVTE